MQAKFVAMGVGAKLPKTDLGISVVSGIYIATRANMNSRQSLYGISLLAPTTDGAPGSIFAGYAYTDWMSFDTVKHPWLKDIDSLKGKTVGISIDGIIALKSRVSISINVVEDNLSSELVKLDHVPAKGALPGTIEVTGIFKKLNANTANRKQRRLYA